MTSYTPGVLVAVLLSTILLEAEGHDWHVAAHHPVYSYYRPVPLSAHAYPHPTPYGYGQPPVVQYYLPPPPPPAVYPTSGVSGHEKKRKIEDFSLAALRAAPAVAIGGAYALSFIARLAGLSGGAGDQPEHDNRDTIFEQALQDRFKALEDQYELEDQPKTEELE